VGWVKVSGVVKNKRHASRKKEAPKANKARFVEALLKGVAPGEAAEAIGIPRSTAYSWKKDDPAFSMNWDDAVETSLDKVETVVYNAALKGNLQAAEFTLKWRRRDVYNNTEESRLAGVQNNYLLNITLQEQLERLDRLGLPRPVTETDYEEDDATTKDRSSGPDLDSRQPRVRQDDILAARDSFWHYRIVTNPRLLLKGMWFPHSLAVKLREFWNDFRAGKRPVMLLMTPPQHGKSLTVIDFISWAIGHDPELRVIYASFSDRLGIRANLRLQRALDSPVYHRIFPGTQITAKHIVAIAKHYLRNHEVLEFIGHEGYFRNTTVPGASR
jgi:hypothetical protein